LGKSLLCNLRRIIIGYLQKLLYTVNRSRMPPTPTSNKFIFRATYGNSIACNIFPA
jgi:hypothetical protein